MMPSLKKELSPEFSDLRWHRDTFASNRPDKVAGIQSATEAWAAMTRQPWESSYAQVRV
ncbi:Uncharacterised protein [Nocardia asteroides]|nr:hypothetical protein SAMN05444423_107248 [Nocardia asteroides]VEG37328.1 Uncharacterised protein [Nocardia asteroides]